MPIPPLDEHGFLLVGTHDCTLAEIKARFGTFQRSDRRLRLFARLEAFLAEAAASRLVVGIVVDGSFVTAKPEPNDIDLIVVVAASHDLRADLGPVAYNVVSKKRVQKRFGFDIVAVREQSLEFEDAVGFFEQVRGVASQRKGLLRIRL